MSGRAYPTGISHACIGDLIEYRWDADDEWAEGRLIERGDDYVVVETISGNRIRFPRRLRRARNRGGGVDGGSVLPVRAGENG